LQKAVGFADFCAKVFFCGCQFVREMPPARSPNFKPAARFWQYQ
jgi:hypothetical protein